MSAEGAFVPKPDGEGDGTIILLMEKPLTLTQVWVMYATIEWHNIIEILRRNGF